MLAVYRDHEDLISIGAYRSGANPQVDTAIAIRDEIGRYLRQAVEEKSSVEKARNELLALAKKCQLSRVPAVVKPAAPPAPAAAVRRG